MIVSLALTGVLRVVLQIGFQGCNPSYRSVLTKGKQLSFCHLEMFLLHKNNLQSRHERWITCKTKMPKHKLCEKLKMILCRSVLNVNVKCRAEGKVVLPSEQPEILLIFLTTKLPMYRKDQQQPKASNLLMMSLIF